MREILINRVKDSYTRVVYEQPTVYKLEMGRCQIFELRHDFSK